MEAECLRSIAKEAEQAGESSFADWCTAASKPVDEDDRAMCLEEFASERNIVQALDDISEAGKVAGRDIRNIHVDCMIFHVYFWILNKQPWAVSSFKCRCRKSSHGNA